MNFSAKNLFTNKQVAQTAVINAKLTKEKEVKLGASNENKMTFSTIFKAVECSIKRNKTYKAYVAGKITADELAAAGYAIIPLTVKGETKERLVRAVAIDRVRIGKGEKAKTIVDGYANIIVKDGKMYLTVVNDKQMSTYFTDNKKPSITKRPASALPKASGNETESVKVYGVLGSKTREIGGVSKTTGKVSRNKYGAQFLMKSNTTPIKVGGVSTSLVEQLDAYIKTNFPDHYTKLNELPISTIKLAEKNGVEPVGYGKQLKAILGDQTTISLSYKTKEKAKNKRLVVKSIDVVAYPITLNRVMGEVANKIVEAETPTVNVEATEKTIESTTQAPSVNDGWPK